MITFQTNVNTSVYVIITFEFKGFMSGREEVILFLIWLMYTLMINI